MKFTAYLSGRTGAIYYSCMRSWQDKESHKDTREASESSTKRYLPADSGHSLCRTGRRRRRYERPTSRSHEITNCDFFQGLGLHPIHEVPRLVSEYD